MTRRGPDRTMRHAQRRTPGLVPGGVAVHQLVAVEVVPGVAAIVPALEEVGVERHEQAPPRIAMLASISPWNDSAVTSGGSDSTRRRTPSPTGLTSITRIS